MTDQKQRNLKRSAFIALVVALVSTGLQVIGYFQIHHQLVSPLISKTITDHLAKPYLQSAAISFIFFLIALLFYRYTKYIITIVACFLIILFQQIYISMPV